MSLYLKLSTKILGKWVVMMVVALASTICLLSSTYCFVAGDWKKCFKNNFLRLCQTALVPIFACCLVILSDLTTIKLKKKISELSAESQTVMSTELAVIQMNNLCPSQQGPDCCSARDHVRSISTSPPRSTVYQCVPPRSLPLVKVYQCVAHRSLPLSYLALILILSSVCPPGS